MRPYCRNHVPSLLRLVLLTMNVKSTADRKTVGVKSAYMSRMTSPTVIAINVDVYSWKLQAIKAPRQQWKAQMAVNKKPILNSSY